jgi:hypothetical protein
VLAAFVIIHPQRINVGSQGDYRRRGCDVTHVDVCHHTDAAFGNRCRNSVCLEAFQNQAAGLVFLAAGFRRTVQMSAQLNPVWFAHRRHVVNKRPRRIQSIGVSDRQLLLVKLLHSLTLYWLRQLLKLPNFLGRHCSMGGKL